MTEQPGSATPPPTGRSSSGRHARPPRRLSRRAIGVLLAAIVLIGGAAIALVATRSDNAAGVDAGQTTTSAGSSGNAEPSPTSETPSSSTTSSSATGTAAGTAAGTAEQSCALSDGLRIAAAPAIAPVIDQLWTALGSATDGCTLTVTAVEPADFIDAATQSASQQQDAWIPDSSAWLARAASAGLQLPASAPVVATSPVVLAVAAPTATAVSSPVAVLESRTSATPVRVGYPDPSRSSATSSMLLELRTEASALPGPNAAITWALRSTPDGLPIDANALLGQLAAQPGLAVPVTEQDVVAANAAAGSVTAVALYPADGYSLDYPFVTLTGDGAAATLTARLLAAMSAPDGRAALAARGFRDPTASPRPELDATSGVQGSVSAQPGGPTGDDITRLLGDVALSNEPSQLLAVLDISGSMASVVPGAGGATRIDLARAAASRGLGLFPATSKIGVWEFSRKIDGANDYRELVPLSPVDDDRLQAVLQGIQIVPDGGTGLYDTTLAAVRAVRAAWDPDRVNSVLLLTDGQNDDLGSISLDQLLATLQAEQDPAKPVPVIAIGFGPDTDAAALQAISSATGGSTYVATDPRDIGEIFLDGIGQRLCRPHC